MSADARWSGYNFLFRCGDGEPFCITDAPELYLQLINAGVLISRENERSLLRQLRLRKNFAAYDTSILSLTIAPTLACNMACSYCYESGTASVRMTSPVRRELVAFIGRFKTVRRLSLTWYGGEPLLEWDGILDLTREIRKLDIPFRATLITNGYTNAGAISDGKRGWSEPCRQRSPGTGI